MFTCPDEKRPSEFRVTIHDRAAEFRLAIEGGFTAAGAGEVEQCWRTAASIMDGRAFVVDLSGVASADAAATELLARMHESGARFVGGGREAARAVAAIAGGEPVQPAPSAPRLSEMLACLLFRLRTWNWRLPAAPHT
jgi:hypothetical protein